MKHPEELTFLKKILKQYRLNVHVISKSDTNIQHVDKGVRQFLGLNDLYGSAADLTKMQLAPNTIYAISDDFFSKYFMMELPNDEELCLLIVGPYTDQTYTKEAWLSATQQHDIPDNIKESVFQYFASLPFLTDTSNIRIILSAFYEMVWKNAETCIFEDICQNIIDHYAKDLPNTFLENIPEATDTAFKMKLLEERYQIESSLIKYISQGNTDKAAATLAGISATLIETRADTRLRDYKNYSIVLNTLFRKGAEAGLVHPLHIDKLSSYFARKIEQLTSIEQVKNLFFEMIRKYCFLVKNHSLKEYSLLIQKVVTRIDADLTADQSLKTHAEILNVHPSYLSTLFRKETGATLTDYVNRKRVEHGIFLLNSTDMQIQTIAQYCGINDINYFTRLFKKHVGKTPSEYKKNLT